MTLDIYEKELNYYNGFNGFCTKNCVYQYLQLHDVKDALFYIDCAPDLEVIEDKKSDFLYQVNYNKSLVLNPFNEKIIKYEFLEKKDSALWINNKKYIDEGRPLIVKVDAFFLPYHVGYLKKHGSHFIIICGYDEKNAYIIDWYYPHLYKGAISLDDLNVARASENPKDGNPFSGTSINYMYMEIVNEGWKGRKESLFLKNIDLAINQYYNGYSQLGIYKGMDGLKKILSIIQEREDSSEKYKKDFLKDLHIKLHLMNKKWVLFSNRIVDASTIFGGKELSMLSNEASDISKQWDILSILILKGSLYKTDEIYKSMIKNMKKIIEIEEYFFEHLYSFNTIGQKILS